MDCSLEYSDENKTWTAANLLSLHPIFEEHNALDVITVIKRDGQVQMTSLREIFNTFVSDSLDQLGAVRKDTEVYAEQINRLLSSAPTYSVVSDKKIHLVSYPFGGIDVVSALGLTPSISCVVFSGAECFAKSAQDLSNDLSKLLYSGSLYMRKGAGATMFDSHDDFEQLHDELGMSGVGALALVRLLGAMERTVDLITFFSLDEKGDVTCIPHQSHLTNNNLMFTHVAIGIRDKINEESSRQMLFFVQNNTHIDDANVDAFFSRLRPDILLIKAAPDSLWQADSSCAAEHHDCTSGDVCSSLMRCRRRALAPANCTDAIVITDSCQTSPTTPPSIFRNDEEICILPFQSTIEDGGQEYEQFGYGQTIFVSKGHNLLL